MMDEVEFNSPTFQRPYQYLLRYSRKQNLDNFSYQQPEGCQMECIKTLLSYCNLEDPTWSELHHFASFLNCQLQDAEQSVFCDYNLMGVDSGLSGFKKFVVQFMIRMSQDFATPSLNVRHAAKAPEAGGEGVFELHQLRRRWEESAHPYLFFNEDRVSMTFINFKINNYGNLMCVKTNQCLERGLIPATLVAGLTAQRVNLNQDFDSLSRAEKLRTLFQVFGVSENFDPDPTYELTTDNVLKMLAIHMRFRCNIPVVVMGETGCGKTRMVEFMSKLKAGRPNRNLPDHGNHGNAEPQCRHELLQRIVRNMMVVKVHGGITVNHLHEQLRAAVRLARKNQLRHQVHVVLKQAKDFVRHEAQYFSVERAVLKSFEHSAAFQEPPSSDSILRKATDFAENIPPDINLRRLLSKAADLAKRNQQEWNFDTMLFLDEANTTEAVYAIKEFVCDGSIHGESVEECGLRIVAACNPYRKHSQEAIDSMEAAGLGFRVKTDDTVEKLGEIPMRCLVYRVIALPPSMQPLVWDFGQLQNHAERKYIEQMVQRLGHEEDVGLVSSDFRLIVEILAQSQAYMRQKRNECHFVSLRDVERCLVSFKWFCRNKHWLFRLVDQEKEDDVQGRKRLHPVNRCLIQAVGMCYHVTLASRAVYRQTVSKCFAAYGLDVSEHQIIEEIVACQSVFLKNINLDDDVAQNEALRENVFMIIMCAEMRIPLFLIGRPGSSKSLAKTIVTNAMQGLSSGNAVFRRLKQIQVLSFQCSPVSDAVGIESVFGQCMKLQKQEDPTRFVAVVVLDEIGLAEDSPKMPLKVLHPLLESGTTDGSDDSSQDLIIKETDTNKRVGFVGISNWALDPAKMNRGVFVHRGAPTKEDLTLTAKGIFTSGESDSYKEVADIVDAATESYWTVCRDQEECPVGENQQIREFFGLRDYYSLLKMIFSIVKKNSENISECDVAYAVLRNFSGGPKDYLAVFCEKLKAVYPDFVLQTVSLKKMLKDNLDFADGSQSRYLLLMSNNFTAVDLLSQVVDISSFQVIFGSSFPQDNNYTEVCRNINRIKMCMESGQTVVLLNLRDLYESLYDALNQHYVTFAGQRYVDLGLGGHRVKCRVAENFRLIVIEDRSIVYEEFPIPLINRLEKHLFNTSSVLDVDQQEIAQRLHKWASMFSKLNIAPHQRNKIKNFTDCEAFVGYTADTAASVVLSSAQNGKVFEEAKKQLIDIACMDSVFRLSMSGVNKECEKWQEIYLHQQSHDNLFSFLESLLQLPRDATKSQMVDVVSFSQILSETDRQKLEVMLGLDKNSIMLLTLQQFSTADEFTKKIEMFLSRAARQEVASNSLSNDFVLLIQCPQANATADLVACAKYTVKNLIRAKYCSREKQQSHSIITFLHSVERSSGSSKEMRSFHSPGSVCVFVDELRVSFDHLGLPSKLWGMSLHEVFMSGFERRRNETLDSGTVSSLADTDFCLDLFHLMKCCVSTALMKLRGDQDYYDPERMKKLIALLTEQDIVSRPFLHCTAKHIVSIMGQRDELVASPESWMIDEACAHDSLNEGGSFTKTLWLYLKRLTSSALAYVISKVDEDRNLDILCSSDTSRMSLCLKELWINLFQESNLFQLKWRDMSGNRAEFLVKGHQNFSCSFPFGRRIVEHFCKLWQMLQHVECEQREAAFHNKLMNSSLNQVLQNGLSSFALEILRCFIQDLVHVLYRSGTGQQLEMRFVEDVVMEIFKAKQEAREYCTSGTSNLVACLFLLFKNVSSELQQISTMLSSLPEALSDTNVTGWVSRQKGSMKMLAHFFVFETALDHLKQETDEISSSQDYRKWVNLIDRFRPAAQAICKHDDATELEKVWKALEFAHLFLDQLIPQGLPQTLFESYLELLVPVSKRLWKGAIKAGLQSEKFLKIVMKHLSGCCKDVSLKSLLNWKSLSCSVCKKKVVDPIVLPCEHHMCVLCMKLSVTEDVKECPKCRVNLPDDFPVSPTQLSTEQASGVETFTANCTSFFLEYLSTLCFPAPGADACDLDLDENIPDVLHDLVIAKKTTKQISPLSTSTFDNTPTVRSFILQLLLRYNQTTVEAQLEKHFTRFGAVLHDKQEIMMIYIQCIEDSLRNKPTDPRQILLLLNEQLRSAENSETLNQVQHLNVAANLRFATGVLSEKVFDMLDKSDEEQTTSVKDIVDALEVCEAAKNYFVKIFCRHHGVNYFSKLLEDTTAQRLVPLHLYDCERALDGTEMPDKLVVSGKLYTEWKKHLQCQEEDEDFRDKLEKATDVAVYSTDNTVQILLAVVVSARGRNEPALNQLKVWFVEHLTTVCHNENRGAEMFELIRERDLFDDEDKYVQEVVNNLLANVYFTFVTQRRALVKDLQELMLNPDLISTSFLPTMPESIYFDTSVREEIQRWKGYQSRPPKEYLCPNNHLYYIGDCTNPIRDDSVCPECKAPIGGVSEGVLKPGNKAGALSEESQIGYRLPLDEAPSLKPAPERSCSRASVCAMRFLLHGVMLIAHKSGREVRR